MQIEERGSAGFTANLKNGVITINHIGCNSTLAQWTAKQGDWDKLWKLIRRLEKINLKPTKPQTYCKHCRTPLKINYGRGRPRQFCNDSHKNMWSLKQREEKKNEL